MLAASVYVFTLMCCVHYVICNTSKDLKENQVAAAKASSEISTGRKQQAGPECSLRKDKGDCSKKLQKYYFDDSTGRCRKFNYTGCGGNLNNFVSIDKCESRCLCSNPKDNGRGNKRITRYFYNKDTGKCQSFKYKGSGGNANRFLSLSACQGVCERATLRNKCKERPTVGIDCNNNSTVQFYYDKHCDCCRKFTYLGCGGNRNRFTTRENCQQKCKQEDPSTPAPPTRPPKPAICFFQNVYGDCDKLLTRYFYDNKLSRCIPFTYSGCGGNENNFNNLKICKKTCENDSKSSSLTNTGTGNKNSKAPSSQSKATTPALPGRPTKRLIPSVCTGRPNRGNCLFNISRYYYDTRLGICRSFIWTGCGGNSNRFFNRRQCERTCLVN